MITNIILKNIDILLYDDIKGYPVYNQIITNENDIEDY